MCWSGQAAFRFVMSIPMTSITLHIWFIGCWLLVSTSFSTAFTSSFALSVFILVMVPLPQPLPRPPLEDNVWFDDALSACSSLSSCCFIFCSWTSREPCSSSIERVSKSFWLFNWTHHVVEFRCHRPKNFLDYSHILPSSLHKPASCWQLSLSLRRNLKLILQFSFGVVRILIEVLDAVTSLP